MSGSSAREYLAALTREIPDFPSPGILFRDLGPVLADSDAFLAVVDELSRPWVGRFDVVAGVEARGFPFAGAIAARHRAGVALIRKAGKTPGDSVAEKYVLEYGSAELELAVGILSPGSRVLIVDDVLATGGTLAAARTLVERVGATVVGIAVVLEIDGLGGRAGLAGSELHVIRQV